jgi:ActR/RegA family two-component response regulator
MRVGTRHGRPTGPTKGWGTRGELLHCLVVDDSKYLLDTAGRMPKRRGVAVVGVASSTAEALRRAKEPSPGIRG